MKTLMLFFAASGFMVAPAVGSGPAPDPATAHYEVKFMTDMIDHHAMAVMMANMCLQKAQHPELRSLCENIIATQTHEIEEMQSWLQSWYGVSYEPDVKDNGQMKKLMSLSGAVFEIEFMQMMIRHHYKAVKEGEQCVTRAYHPELRQLCQNIVVTQTQEIRQMQQWLCSWYQICNWGPKV
jgi:uncharacterized protein (DUF305 family)